VICILYGAFASLLSPFAGFLASGMKRAYNIKDFASTLPGHGGYLDRFDCIIFSQIFAVGLLTQLLYKEALAQDEINARFIELD